MSFVDDQAIAGARTAMNIAGTEMVLRRAVRTFDEETQKWSDGAPTDYSMLVVRDRFNALERSTAQVESTDLKLFAIPKPGEPEFEPAEGDVTDHVFLGADTLSATKTTLLGSEPVWAHEERVGWFLHVRLGR